MSGDRNVRVSVFAASTLCIALLAGTAQAQVPAASSSALALPTPGFMPPFEIARTVRRAGFDPLAPPLREGSIYVVRATDFRGILMRVVVDARSGAIRDASRIVPGPGSYGALAAMPPYAPLPNEVPAYGSSAEYEGPAGPLDDGEMMAPRLPAHPLARANVTTLPPLPRPRPPELAARKPDDGKPDAKAAAEAKSPAKAEVKTEAKSEAKTETKSEAKTETNSEGKPEITGSAAVPPAAAAAPASPATAAAKPGKSLQAPPIND
jgi:hypothetical protein